MSRKIDVILSYTDQFSKGFSGTLKAMTDGSNSAIKMSKQIEKAGKSITKVGAGLTKSVTVPIAGLATAAVTTAAGFEASMSNVEAILGDVGNASDEAIAKAKEMGLSYETAADGTVSTMALLNAEAQKLGATTAWSASEVSQAMQYTAMAGWSAEDNLAGLSGILNLASASGTELAMTSDILTDAITAFGDQAEDASRYADVMTAACTSANVTVETLGESYKYVGALAGSMGYDVDQVTTALAAMGNAGIKGSTAGTALRSAISNMAAPTKEVQAGMDALGLSLTNTDGSMKSFEQVIGDIQGAFSGLDEASQAAYAKQIFGKQAMSGMLAIVNTSTEDYNALASAIDNSGGAAEKAANTQLDNLQGQLTLLKSAVEGLAITFGNKLLPYIKKAAEFVQGLADKFNALSDEQVDMVIKIAAIAAAIGPAIMVFGKLVTTVGTAFRMFNMVKSAISAFGGVIGLITSPVGIVIAVLLAIVAATILVVKNWDKIKAAAQKVFGFVQKIFGDLGISTESFKAKLAPLGEKFMEIGAKLQELWTVVQPVLAKIGEIAKLVFEVYIGAAIGAAIGYFQALWNGVTEIVSGLMTAFGGVIDFITGVFTGNWQKAWDGVKSIFSGCFEALVGLCKTPINAIIGIINGAISGINNLGLTIPDWVPGLGGKSFSINIPTIPALAQGTDNWRGGLAQVSEAGGEIIDLPSGSRVYPYKETKEILQSKAGNTITIAKLADSIVVREESDIDKIAQALAEKLTKVSLNMGGVA